MTLSNAYSACRVVILTTLTYIATPAVHAEIISPPVSITSDDLTLVSSVRVARTIQEYTISAVARNGSSKQYRNVVAQLVSVPAGITIIDGSLNFGVLDANGTAQSLDVFVIRLNLRASPTPQLSDMQWQLQGDEVLQPPPVKPGKAGIFMNIDNNVIKGDVLTSSHKDWIELLTWQDSATAISDNRPGGSGAAKLALGDVSVTKLVDAASPLLREALAKGRQFTEIKIDIIKACKTEYYTQYAITLFGGMLSNLQAASSSGTKLAEQFAIAITAMETSYTPVGEGCELKQPIYSYQIMN